MSVVYLILLVTVVLLVYYAVFSGIKAHNTTQQSEHKIIPISLIICAKNELDNLKAHLPRWINQNYPDFEVIIVNDDSHDGTHDWLQSQAEIYQNLRVVNLDASAERKLKGKRAALQTGINAAKYDYLIFTDADCLPVSEKWLTSIALGFHNGKEIVIGFSPYHQKPGLLNILIEYDTFLTAAQYFGWAFAGFPYMGVGRNIGYKKSVFNSNVLEKSNKSLSGDDDLVVGQVAGRHNTSLILHPDSFVQSTPASGFSQWVAQKTRHVSSGYHYSFGHKIIAGIFPLANILWYALLFILIFSEHQWLLAGVIFLFKTLCFAIVNVKLSGVFKSGRILKYFISIDLIYWCLFLFFQIKHIFRAQNGWSTKKN